MKFPECLDRAVGCLSEQGVLPARVVVHPSMVEHADTLAELRASGLRVEVMAVVGKAPVPLETWIAMKGER